MKNSAGRGGCYPPRPKAEVDNILRDLQNSSYSTKAEFNNCQQLVMVNYACGFNQSETGKYFE